MRKALALALTIMVLLTFVVSPVAAGMFDRKATWEKYKYRCGDGNMGWLRTPDFKNGGFETGDSSYWIEEGDAEEIQVTRNIASHSGDYMLGIWLIQANNKGRVYQYVNLSHATGLSFWVSGAGDWYGTPVHTATTVVYIDDVLVSDGNTYTENFNWTQEYITFPDTYRGVHKVSVGAEGYGVDVSINMDDIHLTGPGF